MSRQKRLSCMTHEKTDTKGISQIRSRIISENLIDSPAMSSPKETLRKLVSQFVLTWVSNPGPWIKINTNH